MQKQTFVQKIRLSALFLLIISFQVHVLEGSLIHPVFTTALKTVLRTDWWWTLLLTIEVLRQLSRSLVQHSKSYAKLYLNFSNDWQNAKNDLPPWTKFQITKYLKLVSVVALLDLLLAWHYKVAPAQVPATLWTMLRSQGAILFEVAILLVSVVGQFALLFWFLTRGGIEVFQPGAIKTRFTDIWGQDSVVELVKENIIFLKNPDTIEAHGGYVPGGILLWGPPGTGKTLLAEAVAGETSNPYVFVEPGAFTQMFLGVGILKVKRLFRMVRKLALQHGGVVLFLDEADSLGNRGLNSNKPFKNSTNNQVSCHGLSYINSSHLHGLNNIDQLSPSDTSSFAARIINRVVSGGFGGMGGGSNDGTLQALLAELSGLKRPKGGFWAGLRKFSGLPPAPIPKYRILTMLASNMPDSLDDALLRPGRIDRIYKVGYPSKEGRVRTYAGYLAKYSHELTPAQVNKLATITPYATGATMKDLVNEALIKALGRGASVITWADIIEAKKLKDLGPAENVEYIDRERHSVAIHEASHAVVAALVRQHLNIDIATIEKGSNYLGMVASIPQEDQFTSWRTEFETDIQVALASLAGERIFFEGNNSSGVSADLDSATYIAALMEGNWGMGSSISSNAALQRLGIVNQTRHKDEEDYPLDSDKEHRQKDGALSARIELALDILYKKTYALIEGHKDIILAVAHALETYKTISGDDILAIVSGEKGPIIDGTVYNSSEVKNILWDYHKAASAALSSHSEATTPLPAIPTPAQPPK